jgi:hypothetical protein
MTLSLNPIVLPSLHQQALERWSQSGELSFNQVGIYQLVEENHAFNYQLWLAEDQARRDDMGPELVYHAKRDIDLFNQQRNNRMEALDKLLYDELQPALPSHCPVHSETPGMIIDRLSILSLKSFHMAIQVQRTEVSKTHQLECATKLEIINQQRDQLAQCLIALMDEIQAKTRTFKVYHQFKMYNDPNLNPQLYSNRNQSAEQD